MSSPAHFDFCVLGGGIAGLSIAEKLLERGASVCLLDIGDIASGASGTPLGMVNPATGRYGTPVWNAEACLTSIANDLQYIQEKTPVQFYKKTGILRPAQDTKMAERMKENALQSDWPKGWCQWLDKDEIHSLNPDLNCVDGGMWLPKGLTVNVELYLRTKSDHLRKQGLKLFANAEYSVNYNEAPYKVSLRNEEFYAGHLIFAAGYETKTLEPWSFLPLHQVKGQLAVFESPKAGDFEYSISALGYIASISKNRFIAGSTYEHHFDHTEPDKEGLEYLVQRLGKVYPSLFKDAVLVDQWAGVRASTPNRKPIIGSHPELEHVHVFTGLGSKGLMYGNYFSSLLADNILDGTLLPDEASVTRFDRTK